VPIHRGFFYSASLKTHFHAPFDILIWCPALMVRQVVQVVIAAPSRTRTIAIACRDSVVPSSKTIVIVDPSEGMTLLHQAQRRSVSAKTMRKRSCWFQTAHSGPHRRARAWKAADVRSGVRFSPTAYAAARRLRWFLLLSTAWMSSACLRSVISRNVTMAPLIWPLPVDDPRPLSRTPSFARRACSFLIRRPMRH